MTDENEKLLELVMELRTTADILYEEASLRLENAESASSHNALQQLLAKGLAETTVKQCNRIIESMRPEQEIEPLESEVEE